MRFHFCRESFILHGVFVGTGHSEATRTSTTMGRSEAIGMRKQLKKTAQVKRNAEATVDRNNITSLFGSKSLKRRVGRPKMTKSQRGSVKKRGNCTSEATPRLKSSKAKTTGKSNIRQIDGDRKNDEEEKKRMKRSAEYFHKMQEFWDEKTGLAIDSNGDPITYFKYNAFIIGMPHPEFYRYCRDDKSKRQLIGTCVGKNITLLNGDDIHLWAM